MKITVEIPSALRRFTDGVQTIECSSETLPDLLGEIEQRFPAISKHLRDDSGQVRRFVNTGYESAKQIIENNRPLLSTIALSLLEREVLDAGELKLILEGKPLPARVLPPKEDGVQQVLKPEPGRTPGIVPGKTSPA